MPTKNNNEKEKRLNLKKYETDVSGVSLNKLEAGLWWLKNRSKFKKISIFILLGMIIFLWLYSLYNLGNYLLFGMDQDKKMLKELVSVDSERQNLLESRSAKDVVISSIGILENSSGHDYYALIKNQNEEYRGNFSYCFMRGSNKIACGDDFVLPKEEKYILVLNSNDEPSSYSLNFVINNLSWKRIDNKLIPDWDAYIKERLNLIIGDILVSADEDGGKSLSFSVKNDTAYSFWEVPLSIIVKKYGKISTVNSYTLKQLVSFEERRLKIKWPGEADLSGEISISPNIDIFNENVYMNPAR
jgi:hypothetical protein